MTLATILTSDLFLAAQLNGITEAVQSPTVGHTHAGAAGTGQPISHANVLDGVIVNRTNTHAQIDAHLTSSTGAHGQHPIDKPQPTLGTAVWEYGVYPAGAGFIGTHLSTIGGILLFPLQNGGDAMPISVLCNISEIAQGSVFEIKTGNTGVGANLSQLPQIGSTFWLAWGTL